MVVQLFGIKYGLLVELDGGVEGETQGSEK